MTVTVYRYDDTSAPTLSATAGALVSLLDACLVNGYGSKSAAGWTKEFSGTNVAAYKQGSGSTGLYMRINNSSTTGYARIVGYESMTDVDTGTNAMPTNTQVSGGCYIYFSSTSDTTNRPWILIADAKRFYLWVGYSLTTAQGPAGSSSYQQLTFFGDITSYRPGDTYHCAIVAIAGASASESYMGASAYNASTLAGHYIMRNHAQTEGALKVSKFGDYNATMGSGYLGYGGPAYPDPITGAFRLTRVYAGNGTVTSTAGTRGHYPGLWAPINTLVGSCGDTFSGSGELSGKTFILLDCASTSVRCRVAIETSDTWD